MQASRVSSHTTTQAVEAEQLGLNIDTCLQEKDISGICASGFLLLAATLKLLVRFSGFFVLLLFFILSL